MGSNKFFYGSKTREGFSVKVEKMPFLNGYGALTRYGVKWMISVQIWNFFKSHKYQVKLINLDEN